MADIKALQGVYTPVDVASYTMEVVDARRELRQRGEGYLLTSGIATLDHYMRPVLPGEVVYVSAFTGHGKTSLLKAWSRNVVAQLQKRATTDEVAVYVTWETLVEELGLYDLCGLTGVGSSEAWYGDATEVQVAKLRVAAMKRAAMPLWVLGGSLKRRRDRPLTLATVDESLRALEQEYGIKPAIIFTDYVQRITPPQDQRRLGKVEQTVKAAEGLYELARNCGCPLISGCQSGRGTLKRDFRLPQVGEAEWSGATEQDADKVIALWYPCQSFPLGHRIPEMDLVVTEDLMICGIRKQRHAPSGDTFPLRFDPAHNIFSSWMDGTVDRLGGMEGVEPIRF